MRKVALTGHISASVGWLGTTGVFLTLALLALASGDDRLVRAIYLIMAPTSWSILVPLAFASLLTGVVLSLGTAWGVVRHYWVLFKLVLNVFANVVLLIYVTVEVSALSALAADPSADLATVKEGPVDHAVLALLLLLVATLLSVFKPRGVTRYGWRKQLQRRSPPSHLLPAAAVTGTRARTDDRTQEE